VSELHHDPARAAGDARDAGDAATGAYAAPRIAHRARLADSLLAITGSAYSGCAYFAGAPDGQGA